MKNIMRRTVAFMLMACLLLSVLAPMGLLKAEAVSTVGNATIYSIGGNDGDTWRSTSSEKVMGDFTGVGMGSGYTKVTVKNLEGKGLGLQANSFYDADKTDETVTKWVALKFTAVNDGEQQVTFLTNGQTVENSPYVCIVTAEAWNASQKNDAYVYGLTGLGITGEGVRYTFDAGKDYVVIFKPTDKTASKNTTFHTITLTLPSFVGENGSYFTVDEACLAGETEIYLNSNFAGDMVITDGITLDLNGKTITGDVVVNNGQIVDNAGNGGVIGTLEATGNEWLALFDGEAYKFFSYTTKTGVLSADKSESGFEEHWFDVVLSKEAYELIAAGNSGIDVEVTVSWTAGDNNGSKKLAYNENGIADWATNEISGNDYALCVQITNIPDGITNVAISAVFTANGASVGFNG